MSEDFAVDGLLELQARAQEMSIRKDRSPEVMERAHEMFGKNIEMFSEWSMPQLYALHRLSFSLIMNRISDTPCQGMIGYCEHSFAHQIFEQLDICTNWRR